jgi:hypothetical protein
MLNGVSWKMLKVVVCLGMKGRGGGGRGYQDYGPPEYVLEAGTFEHPCEGEAVVRFTIDDKVSSSLLPPTDILTPPMQVLTRKWSRVPFTFDDKVKTCLALMHGLRGVLGHVCVHVNMFGDH